MPPTLLLVEDNPDERALALYAFERHRIAAEVVVATDGGEGVGLHHRRGAFSAHYYTMLGYRPGEFPAGYESWRERAHPSAQPEAHDEADPERQREAGRRRAPSAILAHRFSHPSRPMSRILILEDETVIRTALRRLLGRNGYEVAEAGSVREATEGFDLSSFDLILADLRLPGAPGTDIVAAAPGVPVVIMTSYASLRSAVDSIKLGAVDYIAKPFEHDELLLLVRRVLGQHRLARQNELLRSELEQAYPVAGMVGSSPPMREVFTRIAKVAPTDATVLILGESGTGKELVARAVHEQSGRRGAPIVTVNCAAIPDGLIESELFGHEKGAFTGAVAQRRGLVEAADGGTLFLDEIGELPPAAQGRLLRVLQEGEIRRVGSPHARKVNVRLIAATHRDLQQRVREGEFREDLYFRLNVLSIELPPLRERGEDIEALARFLLDKACRRLNRPPLAFAAEALAAIRAHRWPGNVRELENAVERAVILSDGGPITPECLALEPAATPGEAVREEAGPRGGESLEEYFRRFVLEHQERMSETELARRLGISRKTLWERRQRLGLPRGRREE